MVHGQQSLQNYEDHIRLETRIFNPWAIDNMVIILYCTGRLGTSSNVKNQHRIASVIFTCRYAESFPKQILGPACTNDTYVTHLQCCLPCGNSGTDDSEQYTWKAVNLNGEASRRTPSPKPSFRPERFCIRPPKCKPFFPWSMGRKLFHQATHHPLEFLLEPTRKKK